MIEEEGLENVFARHRRLAHATRACVRALGAGRRRSRSTRWTPRPPRIRSRPCWCRPGHDADRVRTIAVGALRRGARPRPGALQGRVFRIGHMGDLNEPMLLGALGAIELALAEAGMPHARGGVEAAMDALRAAGPTR